MKICLLSYFFPPNNSSGAQRWSKLVKYLARRGHSLCVLSAVGDLFGGEDVERGIEMGKYAKVYRFFHYVPPRPPLMGDSLLGKFLKFFAIPDSRITFFLKFGRRILEVIKREGPDVLVATAPPYSALPFAAFVSRYAKVPLAVDLRDPWLRNPQRPNKLADLLLESLSLWHASAVITINPEETFDEARLFNKNVFTVEHFYDPDDFSLEPYKHPSEVWISHVGSIYSPYQREVLVSLSKMLPEGFRLRLVGPGSEAIGGEGAVPRREAFRIMLSSDVLLLLIRVSSKAPRYGSSVRFYDYLGAGKPVVVASDNPFISKKAEEMGFVLADFSAEGLLRAIMKAYRMSQPSRGKRMLHRADVAACEVERILQRAVSTRSS